MLPVDVLVPSELNPRRDLGDLSELATSIREVGVLQALTVRPRTLAGDGTYEIVVGHRRHAAAKLAGLEEGGSALVPCVVKKMTDSAALEAMLVENGQRSDLMPLEEAAAFRRLSELGISQREISRRVGRAQSHISKRLSLLELPPRALKELDSGGISLEEAVILTKLNGHPERVENAFKEAWRYGKGAIRNAAERELDELQTEKKRCALEEELRAQGNTVVSVAIGGRLMKEAVLQQSEMWRVPYTKDLAFTVKRHADEPCHAAVVTRRVEPFWVCTDPSRHGPDGDSRLKVPTKVPPKRTPEEEKAAAEAKAEREATKARVTFMREWLGRVGTGSGEANHVIEMFLLDANSSPARLACELLGIPPVVTPPTYPGGATHKAYDAALLAHAAGSPTGQVQAALALAMGLGEDLLRASWGGWHFPKSIRHFSYLTEAGYEPAPFEAERFQEAQGKVAAEQATEVADA